MKNSHAWQLFLPIVFQFIPLAVFAQIDTHTVYTLDPVIVTATRRTILENQVPGSMAVIKKKEIQGLNQTNSMEESLREVPGVFVNNRYNFSQGDRISIRGLGSRSQFGLRSMKVLLDGIPLTFPDGTTQLNNVNLAGIGRIEILKGPSSSLYGNSAAGVILLHTELADTNTLVSTPRFSYGSFGFLKGQLEASGTEGKSGYFASIAGTNFEGYREFSQARFYNANGVWKHFLSEKTQITAVVNLMHAPFMFNPGGLNKKESIENPQQVRLAVKKMVPAKRISQQQAGLQFHKYLGSFGELKTTFYGISRNLFNPIFGRIIEVDRVAGGIRNVYEKKFSGIRNSLSLLAGIDLELQQDQRKEYENKGVDESTLNTTHYSDLMNTVNKGALQLDQKEQIQNAGGFINLSYNVRKRFSVSGGLRYDYYLFSFADTSNGKQQLSFTQFSPAAGVLLNITEKLNSYLNVTTAFQTPTANEFSNSPDGSKFNRDLKPERVKSTELGFRKTGKKVQADLCLFYFRVNNQLIPYQVSTNSDETFYRNAGETENKGVEVWIQYRLHPLLSLSFSYTYMNYIFTNYQLQVQNNATQLNGKEVPGVPSHRALGGIVFGGEKGLQAKLDLQYTGRYYANDFNGPAPGQSGERGDFMNSSFWLTDVRAGYKADWNNVRIFLFAGVNNLFDVQYNGSIIPNAAGNRFFEPAPGRNYYVGIEVPVRMVK